MSKKENRSIIKISLGARNLSSRTHLSQGIKELWKRSYVKFVVAAVFTITMMSAFLTFCDFFERFSFNLCPYPNKGAVNNSDLAEIARRLFDNNSTNLQVEIQPIPPLNVGQEIFLHFTNDSDNDGYFLAFSIDSEGALFSFIPKSLKLPEIQRYLQIDKGQTLIIPQQNVPEDPFAGIRVDETAGQALLVVILVDELTLELVKALLPEPEMSTSKALKNLHEKLTKQWSSLVIEYETVSSKTKGN